jgi:hypothetical protein
MNPPDPLIDSSSVGDPRCFRELSDLEAGLPAQGAGRENAGTVVLIVRRGPEGRREALDRVELERDGGIPGDSWERRVNRNLEAQITVMDAAVAELIANGQPLTLFGDNLFFHLDVSAANLPPGSRLRAGTAILEVTPKPHNGCRKFRARFGDGALLLVTKPEIRHRNLRGVYMRVAEAGTVNSGDPVEVLARPSP